MEVERPAGERAPTRYRPRRRACSRRRPPSRPHAATLASAPAQKYDDKRAEQPIAAEDPRLTRPTDPTKIRLTRLNCPSVTIERAYGQPGRNLENRKPARSGWLLPGVPRRSRPLPVYSTHVRNRSDRCIGTPGPEQTHALASPLP